MYGEGFQVVWELGDCSSPSPIRECLPSVSKQEHLGVSDIIAKAKQPMISLMQEVSVTPGVTWKCMMELDG